MLRVEYILHIVPKNFLRPNLCIGNGQKSYQTKEETNYHNTFQKTDEENLFSAARY